LTRGFFFILFHIILIYHILNRPLHSSYSDINKMFTSLKRFLLLLPVLLFASPVFSQGLQYGLQLGKSYSHMHGSFVTTAAEDIRVSLDPKLTSRFSGGAYLRYYFTPAFSIQPELLYSTRGGRIKQDIDIRGRDMKIKGNLMMKYVEMPILFRLGTWTSFPEPPRYEPPGYSYHVLAGASIAYNTTARFSGDLSGDVFGVDFDEEFSGSVRSQFLTTDVSVIVGAGFEYGRDTRFTFDVRYVLSILDINNDAAVTGQVRNGTITAMMGILF